MPTSAIARMASGCMRVASVPALATSKRSPASERSSPSAIWLRAELWVHRNSTRRSEERRVGKECRFREEKGHVNKKSYNMLIYIPLIVLLNMYYSQLSNKL